MTDHPPLKNKQTNKQTREDDCKHRKEVSVLTIEAGLHLLVWMMEDVPSPILTEGCPLMYLSLIAGREVVSLVPEDYKEN